MTRDALPHHQPQRVLVRGVNWLGDAVMSLPALLRLRQRLPQSGIILVTPEKLAGLWQPCNLVDSIIAFRPGESPWAVGRRLRQVGADVGLALPNSPRSAIELWVARIPERIGYARPWRNWFLTRALAARPGRTEARKRSVSEINRLIRANPHAPRVVPSASGHQIHEYLHLVSEGLGAEASPLPPSIEVNDEEIKQVASKFRLSNEHSVPLFGLNPGAEYGPAKRWPADRFVSVGARLQSTTDCRWLIFGGSGDIALAEKVASQLSASVSTSGNRKRVVNLAGKTTLRELCALLKMCRVFLTNDTGPMHVAAAVGTPVVTLFGSTSAELTGPGLPGDSRHQLLRSGVACSPCFRRECPIDFRCMTGITVDAVIEAMHRAARL